MKSFAYGVMAAALMAGTALAQTSTPATAPAAGTMASPMATPGTTPMTPRGTTMGTGMGTTTATTPMAAPGSAANPGMAAAPTATSTGTGRAAASGNDNQAVATTTANAAMPAHGANSFTMSEARRRIAARGYTNVANLKKDGSGVWRGTAQQNGASAHVWLDYKGNVGQTAS